MVSINRISCKDRYNLQQNSINKTVTNPTANSFNSTTYLKAVQPGFQFSNNITFGSRYTYDWNNKDNWMQQIEKAVKSNAKDTPLIIRPATSKPMIAPTNKKAGWQNVAVYNPAASYEQLPGEDSPNFHIIYRSSDDCYPIQPSISRWGMVTSKDGIHVDSRTEMPIELPKEGYEVFGMEDPRITKVGDTNFITYCAYSPKGPRLGLMTTKDLKTFTRHGLIGPDQEDKDVVIFPKKINGKFAMMHRLGNDIQIAYFDKPEDLNEQYWDKYMKDYEEDKSKVTVMKSEFGWEEKLGSGPPPIETKDGWLFIHHTSKIDKKSGKRIYTAGAVILDKDDPTKIKHRVPHPLFVPLNKYEKRLSTCPDKHVVFPTGIVEKDNEYFIYSGAGDKYTEVYNIDKTKLLDYVSSFDEHGKKIETK